MVAADNLDQYIVYSLKRILNVWFACQTRTSTRRSVLTYVYHNVTLKNNKKYPISSVVLRKTNSLSLSVCELLTQTQNSKRERVHIAYSDCVHSVYMHVMMIIIDQHQDTLYNIE